MNKAQFIASLTPHFNDSKKEAAHAVDIVFDAITRSLAKGEDVMINDFGKFKKVDRKARKGRNPFTGETIQIKASKKPRFLPAKGLKEVISGARKLDPAPKPALKVVAKPVVKAVAKPVVKAVAKKPVVKAVVKAVAKKAVVKAVAKKPVAKKPVAKKPVVKVAPKKAVVKVAPKKAVKKAAKKK
ncbi:MAG: HU family DNA-binding protein [Actinobacteria bacterium]|nr:HU family DNA-binding protein [Actinomycetota bacterium]